MKHAYILFLATFISAISFGQIIHYDNNPGVMENGQTINLNVDQYGYSVYMHCVNNTGSTVSWKFRRVILNSSTTFTDQFCDNNLCYSCSGTDYTTGDTVNVYDGDSTLMKPVLNFSDGGTASIRYYVLDAYNGDMVIDSVDVDVVSTVGINEVEIAFSAYPNPAADNFFINFQGNEGMIFNLVIYNLVGEEVLKRNISNGTNKISIDDLNNGVYFYSIVTNNEILETKKLIVRH